ncbi:MAG TPA: cupin-like domain-containing protein [Bdellovibrionota bacterium]|nr:cupin-like domain-containing protein [Bdellovibrionota bacterium]
MHREVPLLNRWTGSALFVLRSCFPGSGLLEEARKRNVRSAASRMQDGASLEVDRRKDLSEEEFVSRYLNPGIPVVFDGQALDWPCASKWNLDFLRDRFGEETFPVVDSTGLVEEALDRSKGADDARLITRISAREFVDAIRRGEKPYLRGCPIMETRPELLADLDLTWLKRMRRCLFGVSLQTYVGAADRTTPLHCETTATFFVLADGRKRWTFFSPASSAIVNPEPEGRGYNFSRANPGAPDPERYPGFAKLTRLTCQMRKGDVLFVPAWMWHEVENLSESWGVSYRFTHLRGFLRYPAFAFVRLFLAKPRLLETLYYSFFKGDMGSRERTLLIPKVSLRD